MISWENQQQTHCQNLVFSTCGNVVVEHFDDWTRAPREDCVKLSVRLCVRGERNALILPQLSFAKYYLLLSHALLINNRRYLVFSTSYFYFISSILQVMFGVFRMWLTKTAVELFLFPTWYKKYLISIIYCMPYIIKRNPLGSFALHRQTTVLSWNGAGPVQFLRFRENLGGRPHSQR